MHTKLHSDRPRQHQPHVLRPAKIDVRAVAECLEPLDKAIDELERIIREWSDKKAA